MCRHRIGIAFIVFAMAFYLVAWPAGATEGDAVMEQELELERIDIQSFPFQKYTPYKKVKFEESRHYLTDTRVCIHGDITSLDYQYSWLLTRLIPNDDGLTTTAEYYDVFDWE